MIKRIFTLFCLIGSIHLNAQTGIGTTTPHASAKLEVNATDKGFLPPRVTLTSTTDVSTISAPATGLLVYNLGSVGLQAGYYYWNGANWATIATASSSGNGVTSSNLVKLYSKAYSAAIADSAISNATGYKFTVPVSGRYLFDFSSSGYLNQATMSITFKVRQGTTDLGTDVFTSANNNVHVVFTGMVEVNLQAGIIYNVFVSSSGTGVTRDAGDYDRVYYKMVAGNLPVTGQSVDYVQASLSANQSLSAVANINFNVSSGAGISLTSGGFNLLANKTYKLEAAIGGASGGYAYYGWVDNSNNLLPGGSIGAVIKAGKDHSDAPQDKAVVYYTPTVDTRVFLRVYNLSGTLTAYAPSLSTNFASTWASIQQVGSSAIVNPWTLSGTNTYNTTGNVGIGTNAPTSRLNIVGGGIKIHNGFSRLNSRPLLNTSSIGNYEIRGVGSITGNTQEDLGDDGFLRLSAGGGSDTLVQSSIDISGGSDNTNMDNTIIMRTRGVERLRIDNNGNVNMNGSISLGNPTGNVVIKAAGFVGRGTDIILGNLKVRFAASGNMSLQVSSSSGTISTIGSDQYITNGSGSTTISRSITASPIYLWPSGVNFVDMGNSETCLLIDTDTKMSWRIIGIVGPGYFNNFISIERIL